MKPTDVRQPRALELCAGCGLAALGLARAGWHVHGVEQDADACASHVINVGSCERADITTYHPWFRAQLVCGGVPCTTFSPAGKREGLRDEKGRLYEHLLRIANEAEAEVCMLENSDGLCTWRDERGETAQSIIERAFRAAGFEPVSGVLCAADYGTPQKRYRLFIIGFKSMAMRARFVWPAPTHSETPNLFGLPLWRTVREALGLGGGRFKKGRKEGARGWQGMRQLDVDAPSPTLSTTNNADLIAPLSLSLSLSMPEKKRRELVSQLTTAKVLDRPATTIMGDARLAPAGHHSSMFISARSVLDEPARTVSAGGTASGGGAEPFANKSYREALSAAMLEKPSPTITAHGYDTARSKSRPSQRPLAELRHGVASQGVRLDVAQCLALQGAPPDWRLIGNKGSQFKQAGNGCPPQFTEALGLAILRAFAMTRAA